jgi:hypothetical protein
MLHLARIAACFATLSLLTGCASRLDAEVFHGRYFYHFEASTFTPKDGGHSWCVDADQMASARLPEEEAPSPFGGSWGWADVVVRGELSEPGAYCNMGAYRHRLNVLEVVKVVRTGSGDPK